MICWYYQEYQKIRKRGGTMIYFSVAGDLASFAVGYSPLFDNHYRRSSLPVVGNKKKKRLKKAKQSVNTKEVQPAGS